MSAHSTMFKIYFSLILRFFLNFLFLFPRNMINANTLLLNTTILLLKIKKLEINTKFNFLFINVPFGYNFVIYWSILFKSFFKCLFYQVLSGNIKFGCFSNTSYFPLFNTQYVIRNILKYDIFLCLIPQKYVTCG